MGIKTVSVYSTADKNAMHVKIADEAICIGPAKSAESYLNKQAILSAAIVSCSDAIHPGYGFLSENSDFAEMVETHGFKFIGPSYKHIEAMGDKINAKKLAIELGIPTVPGSDGAVETVEEAKNIAKNFGYPILIKATAGGGGRGMKVVFKEEELEENYNIARSEAEMAFGNSAVYIEKYLLAPKHIEIQIIGDKLGNVVALGERDCSVQRRNQKVIEEAPASTLNTELRNSIYEITRNAMIKLGYYSAGTIEYLYEDGKFYFMEMNTRLQVEHPVTEFISGTDLIYEMIRIADGKPLTFSQKDFHINGHSIECRINAEDPETFIPMPGEIKYFHSPAGQGVRVDSAIYSGYKIPPYYDSMIAKIITHGKTREHAINKMKRCLNEFIIEGPKNNLSLHKDILNQKEFLDGSYNIKWLETYLSKQIKTK
jgi:acetyl-CoA carboxylase biotin carboxylase subunit